MAPSRQHQPRPISKSEIQFEAFSASSSVSPNTPTQLSPETPLSLANSPALDLLSMEEQHFCSTLRVLPKPYLVIKEMYIRENERRKGHLKRRDARKMLKIDVNKSGKIFDFLVASGVLMLNYQPMDTRYMSGTNGLKGANGVVEVRSSDVVTLQ